MLQRKWACITPSGAMTCPRVGRRIGSRPTVDGNAGVDGLPATQEWSELERQTDDRGIALCIGDDTDVQLTGDNVVRVKMFA